MGSSEWEGVRENRRPGGGVRFFGDEQFVSKVFRHIF